MNIIIGMTQLTLDTELDARQRRHLSMVRSSADTLLTIINDILDFSKIEADKLDLDPVPFNLSESIRDVTAILALRAQEKGLDLEVQFEPQVPEMIVGDPVRLGQIVVNLVGNAIKFSSAGKIAIRIALDDLRRDGHVCLRFSIANKGIGIPPEKLAAIFDPFSQADGSTTRRYGGTGLGLTISRRLVEMMDGRIFVESIPGQGSTFIFTVCLGLPRLASIPQSVAPPVERARGIVVMPEQERRRLLVEMLASWHIEAASIDSPVAALEVLKWSCRVGRPFSFALIDASSAAGDQGHLLHEIHTHCGLSRLAVVLIVPGGACMSAVPGWVHAAIEWPVSESTLLQILTGIHFPPEAASQSLNAISQALHGTGAEADADLRIRLKKILVAEDNPANQELVRALLETRVPSAAIRIVGDGEEAIRAATEERFDLILMDIQMPRLGGVEATAALRRIEDKLGCHTPIIALTAHAMKGDRESYLANRMDGYVSKPIDRALLFAEMERVTALPVPQC